MHKNIVAPAASGALLPSSCRFRLCEMNAMMTGMFLSRLCLCALEHRSGRVQAGFHRGADERNDACGCYVFQRHSLLRSWGTFALTSGAKSKFVRGPERTSPHRVVKMKAPACMQRFSRAVGGSSKAVWWVLTKQDVYREPLRGRLFCRRTGKTTLIPKSSNSA